MQKNERETKAPEGKNVSGQRQQVAELIGRLLAKYLLKRRSSGPVSASAHPKKAETFFKI